MQKASSVVYSLRGKHLTVFLWTHCGTIPGIVPLFKKVIFGACVTEASTCTLPLSLHLALGALLKEVIVKVVVFSFSPDITSNTGTWGEHGRCSSQ